MGEQSIRLLSIGEFSSATQLSPKALRLYDEQHLLPPARIDSANGYRYYRSDQVARGRLIRTLREMGLSLADILCAVQADGVKAEIILRRFATEQDRRHANEKRAFYSALTMVRQNKGPGVPVILERVRMEQPVAVLKFQSNRQEFMESFRAKAGETERLLSDSGCSIAGPIRCALLDPLSDDEARLAVMAPIVNAASLRPELSLDVLAASPCAVASLETPRTHASELSGALDALFDWFDRRGYRALDAPLVAIGCDDLQIEIEWAYKATREGL